MRQISFRYFHLKSIAATFVAELDSLADLYRYAVTNHVKDIFVVPDDNGQAVFTIVSSQAVLQHSALGFASLEDYAAAIHNGFATADVYYDALKHGYSTYADYCVKMDEDIASKENFDSMRSGGFEEGYQQLVATQAALPQGVTSAYSLYTHVQAAGFATFGEYALATSKGFSDKYNFEAATTAGFPTAADYQQGIDNLYTSYDELQQARSLGVGNNDDMKRMRDLHAIACHQCNSDQRLLLSLLSKAKAGSLIPAGKLYDVLIRTIDNYRNTDTQQLPGWFTTAITSRETLVNFLQNDEAKRFGTYNDAVDSFQVNSLTGRHIAIDGYTVANNSAGKKDKPLLENIIKLLVHLRQHGFTDMMVIMQPSLPLMVADPDNLEQLKTMAGYLVAPIDIPTNTFLVEYVKQHLCKLVTLQDFRELRVNDRWIADNFDYYKIPFLIKDNDVQVPDLQ